MYFLQPTLFPRAGLLLYSKGDLASNSSPWWGPGMLTKHSLTDTVPHRKVHLWWMGASSGIWDFVLLLAGGHGKHSAAGTATLH